MDEDRFCSGERKNHAQGDWRRQPETHSVAVDEAVDAASAVVRNAPP
jgi:hypothetical protein